MFLVVLKIYIFSTLTYVHHSFVLNIRIYSCLFRILSNDTLYLSLHSVSIFRSYCLLPSPRLSVNEPHLSPTSSTAVMLLLNASSLSLNRHPCTESNCLPAMRPQLDIVLKDVCCKLYSTHLNQSKNTLRKRRTGLKFTFYPVRLTFVSLSH